MPSDQQPASWLADFHDALVARDKAKFQSLFADECYWRDFLAFTWNIVTLEGRERIWDMLSERLSEVKPDKWQLEQAELQRTERRRWLLRRQLRLRPLSDRVRRSLRAPC